MNVAGALARAVRSDSKPGIGSVGRLLAEVTTTQPALAVAGEQESDDSASSFLAATGGISAEVVAARLIEPRFVELVRPVALSDFIAYGSAGIPRLTKDEVGEFLTDVAEHDPGFRRSWLEFAPADDDSESWVAYPQSVSASVDFHLLFAHSARWCVHPAPCSRPRP